MRSLFLAMLPAVLSGQQQATYPCEAAPEVRQALAALNRDDEGAVPQTERQLAIARRCGISQRLSRRPFRPNPTFAVGLRIRAKTAAAGR